MKTPRFNIDVFDEINTEAKAYWLGFILGDGSLSKYSLRMELHKRDRDHLEKLSLFIGGNYPIYETRKECLLMAFNSKAFVEKMRQYIPKDKTYRLGHRPIISDKLLLHFYRGILDSDGWIVEHKLKTCVQHEFGFCNYNLSFLKEIQIWISNYLGKPSGSIRFRKFNSSNGSVAQLIVGGNNNFEKLYHLFYDNSQHETRLTRKYDKASGFYNIIQNSARRKIKI